MPSERDSLRSLGPGPEQDGLRLLRIVDDGPEAADGDPRAEDLGLWRELKVELDELDLEGRGLERLAAELDELEARIADGRLEEADALVGRSLARVLRFPRHRLGWRHWAPLLAAAVLGLLGALWALAA